MIVGRMDGGDNEVATSSNMLVNRVLRVGITGGIGSGKSTVCALFAELGVSVYDSDSRARHIAGDNEVVRRQVVELLGPEAYREGRLDRYFVAAKVFTDKQLLASLNEIIHPAVAEDFDRWATSFEGQAADETSASFEAKTAVEPRANSASTPPYLILESAILFESGFDALVDVTIAVSAPEEVRLARVLARGGMVIPKGDVLDSQYVAKAQAEIMSRMGNQMTDAEREARADHIITNNGTLEDLAARVNEIDNLLK